MEGSVSARAPDVPGTQWVDVLGVCRAAAAELTAQQPTLSIAEFSLFESMNAVELMDPRMDQCYGIKPDDKVENILSAEKVLAEELDATLLLVLLKSLFVYEVAFFDGASLLESTHQCIFLWEKSWHHLLSRNNLYDRIMVTYCQAMCRSLKYLSNTILDGDIYQEEDFQPLTHISLDFDKSDSEIQEELDALVANIAEVNEEVRLFLTYRKAVLQFMQVYNYWVNLLTRTGTKIRTSRCKYDALTQLLIDSSVVGAKVNFAQSMNDALDPLLVALEKLVEASLDSNKPNISVDLLNPNDIPDISFALSKMLVKLHLSTAIRHIVLKPFHASIRHLKGIILDVKRVSAIGNDMLSKYSADNEDYFSMLEVAIHNSNCCYHLLVRTYLVSINYTFASQPLLRRYIHRSMAEKGIPDEFLGNDILAADNQWLDSFSSTVYDTFIGLCINRNKLILKLDVLLGSWGVLSSDAYLVDSHFAQLKNEMVTGGSKQIWFSHYTMISTCSLMDLHMLLLVEMDLVDVSELDYFYWYWDFICSSWLYAHEGLRTLNYNTQVSNYELALKSNQDKKKKNKAKPLPPAPTKEPMGIYEFIIRGHSHICKGLFRMFIVAAELALVTKTENKYVSWDTRFTARFRGFESISNPPMLKYIDFVNLIENSRSQGERGGNIDVSLVINSATESFSDAKKYFDEIRKFCKNNPAVKIDERYNEICVRSTKVALSNSINATKTKTFLQERKTNGLALDKESTKLVLEKTHSKHHHNISILSSL